MFSAEEKDSDRYLITYADLITLLLGLFIILYAMSNIDLKKYEKVISAMGSVFGTKDVIAGNEFSIMANAESIKPVRSLKNEIEIAVQKSGAENLVMLQENERGITIHVLEELLFSSGRAEMTEASKRVLGELSVILKTLENDIRVEGHTDNIPIGTSHLPSNWHLSVARALNTAYFLIEQGSLNPDKVSIVGYSEYRPLASNDSPEGRAKNRRVDIVILNN